MIAIPLYLLAGAAALAVHTWFFNPASVELRNAKKYGPKSWC
jgi:hypothetical protein